MRSIKCDLAGSGNDVRVFPLADFHIGDSMSDKKLIDKLLKEVEETPDTYCILGGDLMDSAIASSIGDTYAETLKPQEQLDRCVRIFAPLADKGKILAVLPGNHENRIYKAVGVDMTQVMCSQLGIIDKYSETTAVLFLRVGNNQHKRPFTYTVYCTHGSGGGRKPGGKINRLTDYANIVDADIYICGHTHMPAMIKQDFFRTNNTNSVVQKVERTFINTASALNYGGYGDRQGYTPASNSYPIITLKASGRNKEVRVEL